MTVKSNQAITVLFATANPTTGAAADATGTPTGTLYVNGTANAASVTVTNITTGLYKAALTLPALSAGDVVSLRVSATVATVAGEGVVWQDTSDTKRVSDLNDLANGVTVTTNNDKTGYALTVTPPTAAQIRQELDSNSTQLAAILLDTGTTLDTLITDLPTNSELATALAAADDAVLAAIAALNNLSSAQAQAAAAAALTAYDAATGTDVAGLATAATAAAIKAKTDQLTFTTPGYVDATATADVDEAAIAEAVVTAIGGSVTATVAISAADAATVATGSLALRTYHTWSQAITSTSTAALGTATKVWLAIKLAATDPDSAAVALIEKTAGLLVLKGSAYGTPAHGTLVVSGSSGAWTVTLGLDEAAMALLEAYVGRILVAEVKALVAGDTVPVWDGTAALSAGVVRAVS